MERCSTVKSCCRDRVPFRRFSSRRGRSPAKGDEIRTSAMGNCSIALEDRDNQINPYDYGRNPAYLGSDFDRAWIRCIFSIDEQKGDLKRPYDPHLLNNTFIGFEGRKRLSDRQAASGVLPLRSALAARAMAFARARSVQRSVLPHRSHDGGHQVLGTRRVRGLLAAALAEGGDRRRVRLRDLDRSQGLLHASPDRAQLREGEPRAPPAAARGVVSSGFIVRPMRLQNRTDVRRHERE